MKIVSSCGYATIDNIFSPKIFYFPFQRDYTYAEVIDGKLHDNMIDSYVRELYKDANMRGVEIEILTNIEYSQHKKYGHFIMGYPDATQKNYQEHEVDIMAYYPTLDEALVVEVKTTDHLKARKKANKQLGYDTDFAKWLYGCDVVTKQFVFNRNGTKKKVNNFYNVEDIITEEELKMYMA